MKPHLPLLLLTLLCMAFSVHAQDFKVVDSTNECVLKEVTADFYYLYYKEDEILLDKDTFHIKNDTGVFLLPIDNGKQVRFADTLMLYYLPYRGFEYEGYWKRSNNYYVYMRAHDKSAWISVNKADGEVDTLVDIPYYSPSNLYYANCDQRGGEGRTNSYVEIHEPPNGAFNQNNFWQSTYF